MAVIKEDTHVVLKLDHVKKYLTTKDELDAFIYLLGVIDKGLTADGKCYTYAVVNSDEPYYDRVIKIILEGEDAKGQQ